MQKLSALSWNVQGNWNLTGHTLFRKLRSSLEGLSADVVALQEMCGAEKMLKNMGSMKRYNIFIPRLNSLSDNGKLGFNHNVLLSKYPILQADEITFPNWGQDGNLENCTRADLKMANEILRIYNCHFAIYKVGMATRLRQLAHILNDSKTHNGPIIICGDMNVTIPKAGWNRKVIKWWHQEPEREMFVGGKFIDHDEREIFNEELLRHGFKEALDLYLPTWSPFKSKTWEMFGLKLDWFAVKGLEVEKAELGDYLSDHRSVSVRCRVQARSSKVLPKIRPRRSSMDAVLWGDRSS